MRRLSRADGAGNTDRFRSVGEYLIPNPQESDRQYARYHGHDVAEMALPELRVELRRVEAAWADHGKRLDPTEPRRCWLEQRWLAASEALMRDEAALRLEGRGLGEPVPRPPGRADGR